MLYEPRCIPAYLDECKTGAVDYFFANLLYI